LKIIVLLDYCYEKWREIVRLGVDFVGLQKGREIAKFEKSTKNGNQRNKANPSKYLENNLRAFKETEPAKK
jgi:hypothetical protein